MDEGWAEQDYSSWLPTDQLRRQSLARLRFSPVPIVSEPVLELADVFRTMLTNGGAFLAAFEVIESDEVASWFIRRNRPEYGLADQLLRSPAFADAAPELQLDSITTTGLERSGALLLDGELASSLQWGGAYTHPSMPGAQAKRLSSAFCAALFGDRYDDVMVDYSSASWTHWFKGVAWDSTWVITDRRYRRLTVLCITDVD